MDVSPTIALIQKAERAAERKKFLSKKSSKQSSASPVESIDSLPRVSIEKLTISGNERTNLEYFHKELADVKYANENIISLYQSLSRVAADLHSQEIFDSVHIAIDNQLDDVTNTVKAAIKVNVKEKGIPFLKAESSVKSSSTTASATSVNAELLAAIRNPLGNGEVLKMSLGSNNPTTMQPAEKYISLFYPRVLSWPNTKPGNPSHAFDLTCSAKIFEENSSYFVGFKQHVESFTTALRSRDGVHTIEVEVANRDEMPLIRTKGEDEAKPIVGFQLPGLVTGIEDVVHQADVSTKVSCKYGFTAINTLDSVCNPSKGVLLKGNVEYATPLGSAQFIKSELSLSAHKSLGPPMFGSKQGLTFSVSSSLGFALPLGFLLRSIFPSDRNSNSDTALHLVDRFHLGGPMSLRGFDLFGIGDKSNTNGMSQAQVVNSSQNSSATLGFDAEQTNPLSNSITNIVSNACRPQGISVGSFGRLSFLGIASVPVPIRALASVGAKSFLFVNAGMLGNQHMLKEMGSGSPSLSWNNLFDSPRVSVGSGVAIPIANAARIEVTYSLPLLKSSDDVLKPFQIGVGLTIN